MNSHTIVNTIVEHISPKIIFGLFGNVFILSCHTNLKSAIDAYCDNADFINVRIVEINTDTAFDIGTSVRYSFTKDSPKILVRYERKENPYNIGCKYKNLTDEKYCKRNGLNVDWSFKFVMDDRLEKKYESGKYRNNISKFTDDVYDYFTSDLEENEHSYDRIKDDLQKKALQNGRKLNIDDKTILNIVENTIKKHEQPRENIKICFADESDNEEE